MSRNDGFDRLVRDWFAAEGGRAAPRRLQEAVVAATASRHPRPAWLVSLRGDAYGAAAGEAPRGRISRPVVLVLFAALLVLVLVAGLVAIGAPPRPQVLVPATPPSSAVPAIVASPEPSPSPTPSTPIESPTSSSVDCPGTTGGWPGPAVPPRLRSAARPGLLAGWGQVGASPDGTPTFDVFTVDPAIGRDSLRRMTTLEARSMKQTVLDWSPDGSALDVDWESGTTSSGCTETFVVSGDRLFRPFPEAATIFTDGPTWSPDGSQLAAVQYYGDFTAPVGNIIIANRDGATPILLPKICPRCQPVGDQTWSSDRSVLATAYEDIAVDGSSGSLGVAFYMFATGTWEIHRLEGGLFVFGWLDDRRLLVQSGPDGRMLTVSPGAKGELRWGNWNGAGTLAPDRTKVLVDTMKQVGSSSSETLGVLDLTTGRTRSLPAGGPWPGIGKVVWAPDASAVVLEIDDPNLGTTGDRSGTWLVPLDGSPARQLSGPEFMPTSWQPVWP